MVLRNLSWTKRTKGPMVGRQATRTRVLHSTIAHMNNGTDAPTNYKVSYRQALRGREGGIHVGSFLASLPILPTMVALNIVTPPASRPPLNAKEMTTRLYSGMLSRARTNGGKTANNMSRNAEYEAEKYERSSTMEGFQHVPGVFRSH